MRTWSALAVLALLLAGCSSSPEAPAAAPQATAGPAATTPEAAEEGLQPLSFNAAAGEQTLSQDGTFALGANCLPFGSVVPCTAEAVVDLTSIIPTEVPVQVSLKLTDDAGPGAFISLNVRFEQASISSYQSTGEDDTLVVVVVLMPGGKVEAVVTQFFPSVLPPAETRFTLEARSVVRPTVFPT